MLSVKHQGPPSGAREGLGVYAVGSGMTGRSVPEWDRRRARLHLPWLGGPQVSDTDPAANPPALVEIVTVRAVNRPASFHGEPPWSCR
jgi:hypothetical protein